MGIVSHLMFVGPAPKYLLGAILAITTFCCDAFAAVPEGWPEGFTVNACFIAGGAPRAAADVVFNWDDANEQYETNVFGVAYYLSGSDLGSMALDSSLAVAIGTIDLETRVGGQQIYDPDSLTPNAVQLSFKEALGYDYLTGVQAVSALASGFAIGVGLAIFLLPLLWFHAVWCDFFRQLGSA